MTLSATPAAPVYDAATVATLLGITYTPEQLAAFGPPPTPLGGFITFFDPGLSIVRLREFVAFRGPIFYPRYWYDKLPFATLEDQPRYRQVRRKPLPGSFGKTNDEQCALVPEGEEIPLARIVLTMIVIHCFARKERLFAQCYGRTADKLWDGYLVGVGLFDPGGVDVAVWSPSVSRDVLGVVLARKIP